MHQARGSLSDIFLKGLFLKGIFVTAV